MGNRIIFGGIDSTPNAFSFTAVNNAERSTIYSTSVLPSGFDSANWSVSGGEGSVNGGSTWTTSGSITAGQTFSVRGTSSSNFSTSVNVVVNIGGVTSTFTISTRAVDDIPTDFSFSNITGAGLSTYYETGVLTITGLEPSASIKIQCTGADAAMDYGTNSVSGSWTPSSGVDYYVTTTASGTFVIKLRLLSSSSLSTTKVATLYVGNNTSRSWSVTTKATNLLGEAVFTTPGTYSWTAPAGVTSVNAVAVGGGGSIYTSRNGTSIGGGGGGELRYKNNISVTPGTAYTVVVGDAGRWYDGNDPAGSTNGTDSYFINTSTLKATGGGGAFGASGGSGGSGGVGDGGGNGGNGGYTNQPIDTNDGLRGGGGGGAGGYSGAGGNGTAGGPGLGTAQIYAYPNAGSGGGGGGGGVVYNNASGTTGESRPGGGVGIYGAGASGAAGDVISQNSPGNASGRGGSGGATAGPSGPKANYGGAGTHYMGSSTYHVGNGAVRICWGTGISYPNSAT